MATELNLTSLTEYVNVHKDELLTKAMLGAKTLDYIDIMPNVKYKDSLNYLDSEVVLADGSVCGFDPDGSDVFTDKTIEVKPVKVEKEWCYKDFRKYFMNYQLLFEAGREKLPFEESLINNNLGKVNEAVESLIWNGDSTIGIDGFLAEMADDDTVIDVTAASGASATEKVDAVYAAIPEKVLRQGVIMYIDPTIFRAYIMEQNASCCANRQIVDANTASIKYVGDSRVTILPVDGLLGTGHIVATTPRNLVWATDVEGSENTYKYWFNEEDEKFRFRVLFNAGVAYKFGDYIVLL